MLRAGSLESKGKERELNTETQSTQRSETGRDLEIGAGAEAGLGSNAPYGSSEVKERVDLNADGAEFAEKGRRPPTPGYPESCEVNT